ncbi:hypothetical protein V1515DRAFT_136504 [Lipomyces mesembrius]
MMYNFNLLLIGNFLILVQIFARFRLPAVYGGQPNITLDVSIANDTGSDWQNIFATDLAFLGYNPYSYTGRLGPTFISTAGVGIYREQILIEMQISRADGTEVAHWFAEIAVITAAQPVVPQCRPLEIQCVISFILQLLQEIPLSMLQRRKAALYAGSQLSK